MAQKPKRPRKFYTAKIMINRLFGDGGKYFDNDDVVRIKKINLLKRLKRRCIVIYEELFNEQPKSYRKSSNSKKLYRDGDDKFLGGVASGTAHYVGIEPIWSRIFWLIMAFGFSGAGEIKLASYRVSGLVPRPIATS